MKIAVWLGILAAFFALLQAPARAQEGINNFKDISLFAIGIGAGIVNHELGHQFMASVHGGRMDWRGVNWRYYGSSESRLRNVALGGTAAEIISSEIMLAGDKISKRHPFVLGWLAFNIANSLGYVARYELGIGSTENNDLATIEKSADRTTLRIVEVAKISHALFTAYRLWKSPDSKKEPPRLSYYVAPFAAGEGIITGIQYRW